MEDTIRKQAAAAASIDSLVTVVKGLVVANVNKDRSSREALRTEMEALRDQVEALKVAYDQATNDLEMTQVQMDYQRQSSQGQSGEAAGRIKKLEARVSELEEDRTKLLGERSLFQTEVKKLTEKVMKVDGEKTKLREQNSALESTIGTLEDKVAAVKGDQAQLQDKLASAKSKVQELEDALTTAGEDKRTLLRQRILVAAEVSRLTNQVLASADDKATLEEALCAAEDGKGKLEEKMAAMEEQRETLEVDLAAAKAIEEDHARLLQQRSIIQKEVRNLTDRYVAVSNEKDQLSNQLSATELALSEAQQRALATQLEQARLKEEVQSLEAERFRLENKAADVAKAKKDSQSLMQGEVKRLTQTVVSTSDENSELRQQLAELQGDPAAVVAAGPAPEASAAQQTSDAKEAPQDAQTDPLADWGGEFDLETPEGVQQWLRQRRLGKYLKAFVEQGYDRLAMLRRAGAGEIGSLAARIGMPKGHAQMLERGVKLLKYGCASRVVGEDSQPVSDAEEASQAQPPAIQASGIALDSPEGVKQWLAQRQLQQYLPVFVEQGYDSLEILKRAEIDEFINLVAACDMIEEQGQMLQREIERLKQGHIEPEEQIAGGLDVDSVEGVRQWLCQRRLEKYLPAFLERGYDCLAILRRADAEEIGELIASTGMPKGRAQMLERGMLLLRQEQVSA